MQSILNLGVDVDSRHGFEVDTIVTDIVFSQSAVQLAQALISKVSSVLRAVSACHGTALVEWLSR
jgi:hypothetical protein